MLGNNRISRVQLTSLVLIVLVLGFLFAVQVRSQAVAERFLSAQDNVSLGLLISGLAQSNQRLTQDRDDLALEQQKLLADISANGSGADSLRRQLVRLQVVDGTVPVHGPGIALRLTFKLRAFELQDLGNAMRQLGAEAMAVNGHRLTAISVVGEKSGQLSVDGVAIPAPYEIVAVGDPPALSSGAEQIVASLKARGVVSVQQRATVQIPAAVPERPVVYSSFGR